MASRTEEQQTPQHYTPELAIICADHTRRVEVLALELYCGRITHWQHRKRSRELTQQFVNELQEYLNRRAE